MEAPAQRLGRLPALGEARDDLEVLVALRQPLVDGGVQAERERLVQGVRIGGLVVALEGEAEGLPRGGRRGDESRGGRREEQLADGHEQSFSLEGSSTRIRGRPPL